VSNRSTLPSARLRTRLRLAPAVGWVLAAGVMAAAVHNGRALQRKTFWVYLGAAPLVGQDPNDGWNWRFGWGLVGAGLIATALVQAIGSGWWFRASPRLVIALTSVGSGAFAVALALVDGRDGLLHGAVDKTEYYANLVYTPPAQEFISSFLDRINFYSVHVRGHPPGFTLVLKFLDWAGPDGPWPVVALSVLGTMILPIAMLVTVRVLSGDEVMRRVAPLLIASPYLVWMMTSADAFFTAVASCAVAASAVGMHTSRKLAFGWGVLGGLIFGCLMILTYGGAMFAFVIAAPLAVGLYKRKPGAVLTLIGGVIGAAIVIGGFVGLGFWWLDGAQETKRQYWAGTAQYRPGIYFGYANLATTLFALGPLGFAGLLRLRRAASPFPKSLVVGATIALLASHVSQYSRGEVERIWLLFFPWIAIAGAAWVLKERPRFSALVVALQATSAILLQAALVTKW
jgi:methylthioxylose transferase